MILENENLFRARFEIGMPLKMNILKKKVGKLIAYFFK